MSQITLYQLLEKNTQIKKILQKAKKLNQLEILLKAELSFLLNPHGVLTIQDQLFIDAIKLSDYHLGHLRVLTTNAAFLTRLRFLKHILGERLKMHPGFLGLISVSCHVCPDIFNDNKITKPIYPNVNPIAKQKIKEILEQLASHKKNKDHNYSM